jgi:hypothetical protein
MIDAYILANLIWPKAPIQLVHWAAHIPEADHPQRLGQHHHHHACVHQQFCAQHSDGNEEADMVGFVDEQIEAIAEEGKTEHDEEAVAHQRIPQGFLVAAFL